MKLFYTNSSAKEEIGNLETRISALEVDATASATEIQTLKSELATANETIASLTTERDEAVSAFEAAEATAQKATTEAAEATAKLATFDAEVETAARAKFESLGGPPIPASSADDDKKTLTGAEFKQLSHAARLAFAKDGGKVL